MFNVMIINMPLYFLCGFIVERKSLNRLRLLLKKSRLAQIGTNVKSNESKRFIIIKACSSPSNNDRFLQILLREMEKIKFDCQLSKHFIQFKSNKDLSMYVLMLRFCNTNTCKDADNFLSFASIEMATIFGRCCEGYDKSKSIYN